MKLKATMHPLTEAELLDGWAFYPESHKQAAFAILPLNENALEFLGERYGYGVSQTVPIGYASEAVYRVINIDTGKALRLNQTLFDAFARQTLDACTALPPCNFTETINNDWNKRRNEP